jgi:hypothetical protein
VVDLLRDPSTQKVLDDEEKLFYKFLGQTTGRFIEVLVMLVSRIMEEESNEQEVEENLTKIYKMLGTLYSTLRALEGDSQKSEVISLVMEMETIQNFVTFCIKSSFDFTKTLVRKIYNEILKIFVFILENSENKKVEKKMYKILSDNPLCYRFWEHLSEAILTISEDVHIASCLDQVNWSLSNISLIGE